ncbi:MAG: alpha/beta fold hydrolase [Inquilinaceae bacterium]
MIDYRTMPDGVRVRTGFWPAVGEERGLVTVAGGRSEFIEKYAETAADLSALGFAVRTFDWRGQGLSSRSAVHPYRGHLDDYQRLIADLEVLTRPRDTGPPQILLAHSMGGLVALRFLAEHPGRFRAAVLSAPLVGLAQNAIVGPVIAAVARLVVACGGGAWYAPGQGDYDAERYRQGVDRLTSDPARGAVMLDWIERNPDLRLGGATWGWLDATYRSAALLRDPAYVRRIDVPVLIAMAGKERLVSNSALNRLARRLPKPVVKVYPDALHELLMERDEIRDALLADIDAFLADCGF